MGLLCQQLRVLTIGTVYLYHERRIRYTGYDTRVFPTRTEGFQRKTVRHITIL